MDKVEFSKFAAALRTYYPREKLIPNQEAMELWYMQLNDIPYEIATIALNKWVALNKYSPAISEIRETASELVNGEVGEWGDAWEEVRKAIGKFGIYRTEEAMESLSPLAREATKRIGFRNICLSDNITADRANFKKVYESLAEREKKNAQVSDNMKQLIAKTQGALQIECGKNPQKGVKR